MTFVNVLIAIPGYLARNDKKKKYVAVLANIEFMGKTQNNSFLAIKSSHISSLSILCSVY